MLDAEASTPRVHATRATKNVHPLIHPSAEHCTEQMGIAGAWHDRLPHFRMGFTPSAGEELQAEYLIPRTQLRLNAFNAINDLRDDDRAVRSNLRNPHHRRRRFSG